MIHVIPVAVGMLVALGLVVQARWLKSGRLAQPFLRIQKGRTLAAALFWACIAVGFALQRSPLGLWFGFFVALLVVTAPVQERHRK